MTAEVMRIGTTMDGGCPSLSIRRAPVCVTPILSARSTYDDSRDNDSRVSMNEAQRADDVCVYRERDNERWRRSINGSIVDEVVIDCRPFDDRPSIRCPCSL